MGWPFWRSPNRRSSDGAIQLFHQLRQASLLRRHFGIYCI